MTRSPLGSWISALRRSGGPVATEPTPMKRGWEPLPDDVLEWMGANPYPLETERLEESA
jgi:hypothetical protein